MKHGAFKLNEKRKIYVFLLLLIEPKFYVVQVLKLKDVVFFIDAS